MNISEQPIGVLDSGTGGIGTLKEIVQLLPCEDFIYYGDAGNAPYGTKSTTEVMNCVDHVLKILLARNIKALVIACNTATAYGFAGIESSIRNIGSPVRVIGVVKAGSRAAVECVRETPESFAVGVLSTPGTFSSGIYPRTIALEAGRMGVASPRVVARGCQNLADSIQFVKPDLEELVRKYFMELVDELRKAGTKEKLRAVIFGCTHYPLARRHFEKVLMELRDDPVRGSFVAEDFTFIDPAVETAIECREILSSEGLLARRMGPSEVAMFVSVPSASLPSGMIGPDGTLEDGYKYSRKPGRDVVDTKFVPLAVGLRDREKFASLLGILPAVSEHLKGW